MPTPTTGQGRLSGSDWTARVTVDRAKRQTYHLPSCRTREQAEQRCNLLAEQAQRLRRAGHAGSRAAATLLEELAAAPQGATRTALQVVGDLCGGQAVIETPADNRVTFGQLAKQWSGGDLAKQYRDHVKAKKTADLDVARFDKLNAIDVGGQKLGDIPIADFTLDHALTAMAHLPESARTPATRRQYAQLIHRVLELAVFPCRVIDRNPLPKGFMPKTGKSPAHGYLYPDEDAQLMGCTSLPLRDRLLFGFLAREGCRTGEATSLTWADLDLEHGSVAIDRNKTHDPRAWALDPGVVRALRIWHDQEKPKPTDYVFRDDCGNPYDPDGLARPLRAALKSAGVTRRELFARTDERAQLRAHDLRGTFVTLALATGQTETWVADRTGHGTSTMINRYRRNARSATELGLGWLHDLDKAIPELARWGRDGATEGQDILPCESVGGSNPAKANRKPKWRNWQTRRTQNPLSERA